MHATHPRLSQLRALRRGLAAACCALVVLGSAGWAGAAERGQARPRTVVATAAAGQAEKYGPFGGKLSPLRSPRDLGNTLCMAYALYCADLWRSGLARRDPFNLIISEVCLHVRVFESEDAGIACVETAIRSVVNLPDSVLVDQQFGPGERRRNVLWFDKTDRQWGDATAQYFMRIPTFCDHSTPVIWDYFPCLLREVQFFQTILKRYQLR